MSFFGSLMGDFMDDDPFFGAHMRQMNNMMNMFADPFGVTGGQLAIAGSRGPQAGRNNQYDMMPFGFPSMGLNMNRMFNNFENMGQNGSCHTFSSSSYMTMTNSADGRPQVYQESTSTRIAPGGIKETKKTVCDSRTGTKKMAIGHHIGERAHIVERQQNLRNGDLEENQEYINLEEEEAEEFDQEWKSKAERTLGAIHDRHTHQRTPRQLALPSTAPSSQQPSNSRSVAIPRRRQRHPSTINSSSRPVEIVECSSDEKEVEENTAASTSTKPTQNRKREHSPNLETKNKRHVASKTSDD